MSTIDQTNSQRPMDAAAKGVTAILGVGVVGLFLLPTFSLTSDWGESVSFSFGDVRRGLGFLGYDWVVFLAALGILVAAGSALLLRSDSEHRRTLMVLGSLIGLTLPIAFIYWAGQNSALREETLSVIGSGFWVYTICCVAAAIAAPILNESHSIGGSTLPPLSGDSVQTSIPLLLGIGLLMVLATLGWEVIAVGLSIGGAVLAMVISRYPKLDLPFQRTNVITIGALAGATLPVLLYLNYFGFRFSDRRIESYFDAIGIGPLIFACACIAAALLAHSQRENHNPTLDTTIGSSDPIAQRAYQNLTDDQKAAHLTAQTPATSSTWPLPVQAPGRESTINNE